MARAVRSGHFNRAARTRDRQTLLLGSAPLTGRNLWRHLDFVP